MEIICLKTCHGAYANIGIGKFDRKHAAVNSVASKGSKIRYSITFI